MTEWISSLCAFLSAVVAVSPAFYFTEMTFLLSKSGCEDSSGDNTNVFHLGCLKKFGGIFVDPFWMIYGVINSWNSKPNSLVLEGLNWAINRAISLILSSQPSIILVKVVFVSLPIKILMFVVQAKLSLPQNEEIKVFLFLSHAFIVFDSIFVSTETRRILKCHRNES